MVVCRLSGSSANQKYVLKRSSTGRGGFYMMEQHWEGGFYMTEQHWQLLCLRASAALPAKPCVSAPP